MATVRVTHGIGDLASDLSALAAKSPKALDNAVRKMAVRTNALAKANASEQHTMFSDVDIDYAPSFTVERRELHRWELGPDQSIGDGSKAPGYEHGSINQASPHRNLDRALDITRPEFGPVVSGEVSELFGEAGFR